MVQHAIDIEDKQARRETILAAARQLFLTDGRRLPSAARIAQAAGLAKGTVYLYFRTKEEIFAALLTAEWAVLLDEVNTAFWPDGSSPDHHLARFTHCYVAYLSRHPQLMRLDAMGYSILENNLPPAQLQAYKAGFMEKMDMTGRMVDQALHLPPGRGLRLLMRTYALTRGLWQTLDGIPPVGGGGTSKVVDGAAVAKVSDSGFTAELADALREYWRGALLAPAPANG